MNKTLRTKSSNNRIGGLLMIMTLGVLMMTPNSATTAQTFKNELIGTWVGVDKPNNKITFAADELTSLEDGTEHKVKYTRLSNDEIRVELNGRMFQIKITFEGEVLTMKSDNQPPTKFKRESSGSTVNKAQPFKNELIGTWRNFTSSRKLATFTADEVTFYYDLADLDEGRGPDLEEKKFKYTNPSKNEIELTSDGKISQTKIILDGKVLIVINDKGIIERYTRGSGVVRVQPFKTELTGTWIGVDDPKMKIEFTAGEVAFRSFGVHGKYTFLSNNVIRVEAKGEVLLVQITFEGEVLTMTVAQGSFKYKRESTNAANSNSNATTTAQTVPIDYQKFKEFSTLSGHSAQVRSVTFSPDGKTLASGSWDDTIKLWNVESGSQIKSLSGHTRWVHSVVFSPDGKTLASGSDDRTVKLWNVADGKELSTLLGYSYFVYSVAFSPDGKTLASGSDDTTIKLWRAK